MPIGFDDIINANSRLASESTEILQIAGTTVHAEQRQRIFVDGKASDGGKIGDYSTKPTHISVDQFAKKPRLERFKNGKTKKSIRFSGGYKAFRSANGRQVSFVDLNFTGTLFASYQFLHTSDGFELGFINELEAKKMFGNEKRFRKNIIEFTDEEEELIDKIISNEIDRTIGG